MILVLILIVFIYAIILGILLIGILQLQTFKSEDNLSNILTGATCFSIVIPFRNEAEHLPKLLASIKEIDYPTASFEIIFVDDASEDNSIQLITNFFDNNPHFDYQILSNIRQSKSPKKDAITTAIEQTKNDWILTTDADCQLPINWLRTYHQFIELNNPKFIAGPIVYTADSSWVQQYQQLDGLSLQGVAMGSFGIDNPFLCNGANLGYLKSSFFNVKGFEGNDHIASGDDTFLLEKIKETFPNQVHFVKSEDAIVITQPMKNWRNIIGQRIRWASKTSKQQGSISQLVGLMVFAANLIIIVGGLFCFMNNEIVPFYLGYVIVKISMDYLFLRNSAQAFHRNVHFQYFIISFIIYPWVTVWVTFLSLIPGYRWKGRIVR